MQVCTVYQMCRVPGRTERSCYLILLLPCFLPIILCAVPTGPEGLSRNPQHPGSLEGSLFFFCSARTLYSNSTFTQYLGRILKKPIKSFYVKLRTQFLKYQCHYLFKLLIHLPINLYGKWLISPYGEALASPTLLTGCFQEKEGKS